MADTITFNDGVNPIVTLPAPDYPGQDARILDQSVQQAMGGRITSITRGAGVLRRWKLVWQHMSESDFDALLTFIYTTVIGATNPFTYTDVNAAQYVVKYTGGLEKATLANYDSRVVELELAEVV